MMKPSYDLSPDQLLAHARAKLNLETAKIQWSELARFFAGGKVLVVSNALDLIDVAATITIDDTAQVTRWLETFQLERVNDAQAIAWSEAGTELWTVVVSPWVLVQEEKPFD